MCWILWISLCKTILMATRTEYLQKNVRTLEHLLDFVVFAVYNDSNRNTYRISAKSRENIRKFVGFCAGGDKKKTALCGRIQVRMCAFGAFQHDHMRHFLAM